MEEKNIAEVVGGNITLIQTGIDDLHGIETLICPIEILVIRISNLVI